MGPDWWLAHPYRFAWVWLTGRWRQRHRWNDWHPLGTSAIHKVPQMSGTIHNPTEDT